MRWGKEFLSVMLCQMLFTRVTSIWPIQTQTNSGTIEGYIDMVEGTLIEVYKGIPYAEPPIGNRRFKKPAKKEPWTGVLQTKVHKYSCMQGTPVNLTMYDGDERWQPNTEENEDCLTLNIWNPHHKTKHSTVMVFIHGGSFVRGTSTIDMFDGATLAAFGNVTVVSLNYRVGVFGFLYLGTSYAPGNQGLMDQKMAIEWVKENIGYFRGDPESITLFGQSAGGASVTAHLLSPKTREMFKRGIIQSGTLNAPGLWLYAKRAKKQAKKIIKAANCKRKNKIKSIRCLRKLNGTTLALLQLDQYSGPVLAFVPTIDGVFLPDNPLDMLREGNHGEQDILIGNVKDEGTFLLLGDPEEFFNDQDVRPIPRTLLHAFYDHIGAKLSKDQRLAIKYEYTDWTDVIAFNNQGLLADAIGDRTFLCPSVEFAKNFYQKNNFVYYYYFTQRTSSLLWGEWMGVVHRAELEYLFGLPKDLNKNYTNEERHLSTTVMRYFTDFAKYGNPSPENGTWPLYSEAIPEYVILNAEYEDIGIGPKPKQCALWNWLLPSLD